MFRFDLGTFANCTRVRSVILYQINNKAYRKETPYLRVPTLNKALKLG